jgi:hypothetical protein
MGLQWDRTKEQKAYLDFMLPQYLEAQGNGKGPAFILFVVEEWFKQWPESDRAIGPSDLVLTAEENAQRRSLIASAVTKRRKVRVYLSQIGNIKLTKFDSK